jgi:hypothetical protein
MEKESRIQLALLELGEKHRSDLPHGYLSVLDRTETEIRGCRPIGSTRARGALGTGTRLANKLRDAVLAELYLLCCTKNSKYTDLRRRGEVFSQAAAASVAGYVAATLGIALAAATAGVAFAMLLLLRLGQGTFCALMSTNAPSAEVKSRGKTRPSQNST